MTFREITFTTETGKAMELDSDGRIAVIGTDRGFTGAHLGIDGFIRFDETSYRGLRPVHKTYKTRPVAADMQKVRDFFDAVARDRAEEMAEIEREFFS